MSAELSWIVTIVGLAGFWLAGNKVWWAWYINIGNQLLWVAFAIVSGYYAFLLGTAFYLAVFIKNAYQWTVDHMDNKLVGERMEYVFDDEVEVDTSYLEKGIA